ncbi:hypothetical protein ACFQ71_02900 [Streptomyces sp. NPDC056534]|uniref:hypothetical protein n=1 Tax=Streptomyces sp. NPDC056534 TaxID=3345857 RepID=UPI0036BDD6BA
MAVTYTAMFGMRPQAGEVSKDEAHKCIGAAVAMGFPVVHRVVTSQFNYQPITVVTVFTFDFRVQGVYEFSGVVDVS